MRQIHGGAPRAAGATVAHPSLSVETPTPRVTVVVPCYNHGRYLSSAIESVLRQTYSQWEAIIVDDGSTDDTAEVAARVTDARLKYHYQSNRGLSAARNCGIGMARGRYLAFLDADDEWEPRFLEQCVAALEHAPNLAGVYTLYDFINEAGDVLPQPGGAVVPSSRLHRTLLEGGFFPPNAVVVRLDVTRQVGMFDAGLPGAGAEDWDLWLRITEKSQMLGIPQRLARYRVSPGSMSTDVERMHTSRMAVLQKMFGSFSEPLGRWPEVKRRAYAFACRSKGLAHLQRGEAEAAWHCLAEAATAWLPILLRLDTYYEFACGAQPRGYRGSTRALDLAAQGDDLLERLTRVWQQLPPEASRTRIQAEAKAYLSLAMLNDQAGHRQEARSCLLRAVKMHPRTALLPQVARRLLRLCVVQLDPAATPASPPQC